MCLEKIDKVTKKGRGYGYKWFVEKDDGLHEYFGGALGVLSEGVWIEDPLDMVLKRNYRTGFHVFLSKDLEWDDGYREGAVLRKVKYQYVVASGKQDEFNVIVARKMYIIKGEV